MKTVVITAVHGRATHLRRQLEGLANSDVHAAEHVVVAINDAGVGTSVARSIYRSRVVELTASSDRLPVAAARNIGAQNAIDSGAELLVFLDVDCIPAPSMIRWYQKAAEDPRSADALLCGPVTYLAPPGPSGYDVDDIEANLDPHPARPAPPAECVIPTTDYELFWSLSFAVTTVTWQRIGGFCTDYSGYGAEDTDFAQLAAGRGVPMCWVGGAHAFHQYHPVSDPPVEHLADIVTNANVFHRRWGWWPMRGWLDAFSAAGLLRLDGSGRPHLL